MTSQILSKMPDDWRPLQGMCEHHNYDSNWIHWTARLRFAVFAAKLLECDVVVWIQERVEKVLTANHFSLDGVCLPELPAALGGGKVRL